MDTDHVQHTIDLITDALDGEGLPWTIQRHGPDITITYPARAQLASTINITVSHGEWPSVRTLIQPGD